MCKEEQNRKMEFGSQKARKGRKRLVYIHMMVTLCGGKRESAGMPGTKSQGRHPVSYMRPLASSDVSVILHCPCCCGRGVKKEQLVAVEIQLLNCQITFCGCMVPGLMGTKGENFIKCQQNIILPCDLS